MEVLIAAVGVMCASLAGAFFTSKVAESFLLARLPFLISFSAGVFLVTAGALALEVFHVIENVWFGAILIAAGYGMAWLLGWLMPETHHHHDDQCAGGRKAARKILVGDGIHNIADGVVLTVAFAASPVLGVATTVSVIIHEVLQEVAEFFVLRRAGYSTFRALAMNFLVSSTILVGVLLGTLALATTALEGLLLALSAGFFAHVVLHDLLPKPHQHDTRVESYWHFLVVLIGIILMALINLALGDTHEHGNSDVSATETEQPRNDHGHEDEGWWTRLLHGHE